jgi:WD40 repeat protein
VRRIADVEDTAMKIPRFELTRVYEDGTQEPPQIVPVMQLPWDMRIDRRGFLGAALMAGVALATTSCARSDPCEDGRAHKDSVLDLAISPDGKLLVSKSNDRTIKLWSLPEGALVKTLQDTVETPQRAWNDLVISPDGKLLVSGSRSAIKLWNLPDGILMKTLKGPAFRVPPAISPDGKLLVSGSIFAIKLWSLPDGALMKTLQPAELENFVISPDGKLLASKSWNNFIRLWSLPDGNLTKTLGGHRGTWFMAITPDGKLLVSGSRSAIKLWSLPDGNLTKTLEWRKNGTHFIAIVSNGKLLVSRGFGTIEMWNLPDGSLAKTLKWHEDTMNSAIAIAPDGKLLALIEKCAIHLWRLPDMSHLTCLIDLAAPPTMWRARPIRSRTPQPDKPSPTPCPAVRRFRPARPARATACRGASGTLLRPTPRAAAEAAASAWPSASGEIGCHPCARQAASGPEPQKA